MKLSISWNKKPPTEVAGKLEYYDIEVRQNYGLLSDDYASVKTHFSYQISVGVANPRMETVSRIRTVTGTPKEVYDYNYDSSIASRDMFVRGWKTAQNKNLEQSILRCENFPYYYFVFCVNFLQLKKGLPYRQGFV